MWVIGTPLLNIHSPHLWAPMFCCVMWNPPQRLTGHLLWKLWPYVATGNSHHWENEKMRKSVFILVFNFCILPSGAQERLNSTTVYVWKNAIVWWGPLQPASCHSSVLMDAPPLLHLWTSSSWTVNNRWVYYCCLLVFRITIILWL